MVEYYQKVACIGLRNPDDSYQMGVPLYVQVSELNKNGMTDTQKEVIHRISEIMMKHYGRQLADYMAKKQKENMAKKLQEIENESKI